MFQFSHPHQDCSFSLHLDLMVVYWPSSWVCVFVFDGFIFLHKHWFEKKISSKVCKTFQIFSRATDRDPTQTTGEKWLLVTSKTSNSLDSNSILAIPLLLQNIASCKQHNMVQRLKSIKGDKGTCSEVTRQEVCIPCLHVNTKTAQVSKTNKPTNECMSLILTYSCLSWGTFLCTWFSPSKTIIMVGVSYAQSHESASESIFQLGIQGQKWYQSSEQQCELWCKTISFVQNSFLVLSLIFNTMWWKGERRSPCSASAVLHRDAVWSPEMSNTCWDGVH